MGKRIRQEVTFTLGDTRHTVTPTFATLDKIEERLSTTLFSQRLYQHDVRVSDIAWVYFSALFVNGTPLEYDDIGEQIIEDGLGAHIPQVSELIGAIINPGPQKPVTAGSKKKTKRKSTGGTTTG